MKDIPQDQITRTSTRMLYVAVVLIGLGSVSFLILLGASIIGNDGEFTGALLGQIGINAGLALLLFRIAREIRVRRTRRDCARDNKDAS